jgi:DNA invertase Pin-like site-specific DNA recombinase
MALPRWFKLGLQGPLAAPPSSPLLNHTCAARLAETYAETRTFLENGGASASAEEASSLRTAVPRLPKRHSKQLTSGQVDELVAAYQSGTSAKTVAAEFGVHRTTVAAYLERRGITKHDLKVLGK